MGAGIEVLTSAIGACSQHVPYTSAPGPKGGGTLDGFGRLDPPLGFLGKLESERKLFQMECV